MDNSRIANQLLLDLIVEMANVADNGLILHSDMIDGYHIPVTGGGHKDVSHCLLHGVTSILHGTCRTYGTISVTITLAPRAH